MAAKSLPSAEYLRQCFIYDPETGSLTWRTSRPREHFTTDAGQRRWITQVAGRPAGSLNRHLYVSINRVGYQVHRVIWKMVSGIDPTKEIDHRNGDKTDNRWRNLREATRQQNVLNTPRRKQKGTLPKGVSVNHKRYAAHIKRNGKQVHLGTFDTPTEAHSAYCEAARELDPEFFNPG
jgi:hypothetical protein